ncbi:MAG: flippase-like domain-containing protein [Nitrospirota bacterium]|nr:flippase-like domain-containing protein [Nitrospirota bacterium]
MGGLGSLRKKIIASLGLGIAVFGVLAFYGNYQQTVRAFQGFDWAYLPAILFLAFLNYLLRFLRWEYYLAIIGLRVNRWESLLVFFSGLAMSVTPGKVGELLKSYLLKELSGAAISRTAPVVVAERVTDFVAIVALSAFGVVVFGYGTSALIASGLLIVALLAIISSRSLFMKLVAIVHRMPVLSRVAPRLETAYESARGLLAPGPLAWATIIGVASWFAECYGLYLVFKGFGVSVSVFSATFVYAFSTLVGALTMLPGGLGATEGSMTGLLVYTGVATPIAVAATFIIRVCTLWFAVLLGCAALILCGRSFKMRTAFDDMEGRIPGGE